MPDNAAHIVVNALAVEEMEGHVRKILERLFPDAVIELREASTPEPMILDVLFLEIAPGSDNPTLTSRGEEMALEVERRLHEVLRR